MAKREKPGKLTPGAASAQSFSNNPLAGLEVLRGTVAQAAAPSASPVVPATELTQALPRFPNKIVIRWESKGRSGKTVTRISGLPHKELPVLAKQLKKALGCGATVEGADLLLLGSLVERAAKWFEKAGATNIIRGN